MGGVTMLSGFDDKITEESTRGKSCLVIGGSGGLGSLAIQVLKAWGAKEVDTICISGDSGFVQSYTPVDRVFDYDLRPEGEVVLDQVKTDKKKYDLVLNACDDENECYKYTDLVDIIIPNGWYLTTNTTFWKRADALSEQSFPKNLNSQTQVVLDIDRDQRQMAKWFRKHGINAKWTVFNDRFAVFELRRLKKLAEAGAIKPVVTETVDLENAIKSFKKWSHGESVRGKTVVSIDDKC